MGEDFDYGDLKYFHINDNTNKDLCIYYGSPLKCDSDKQVFLSSFDKDIITNYISTIPNDELCRLCEEIINILNADHLPQVHRIKLEYKSTVLLSFENL
jgi:hypothetical protein